MRSITALHLVLLSLTTSSLSAPIPVPVEECSHYASCREFLPSPQRSRMKYSEESSHLQEPHFPTHQLEFPKQADTVQVRLVEHHLKTPQIAIKLEPPIKNPKLNAILKAAHRDKASSNKKLIEPGRISPSKNAEAIPAISKSQLTSSKDPEVKSYSSTTRVFKKVQSGAATWRPKCRILDAAEAKDKQDYGRMTITYTYGYRYIRTDYTSVLVVSIVVIFFLAVILVELLDKVIEISRALLGLDQGAIRLEDCHCERNDVCPPYTYTPTAFQLMPAPPPRSARSQPQLVEEVLEKTQGIQDFKSELA